MLLTVIAVSAAACIQFRDIDADQAESLRLTQEIVQVQQETLRILERIDLHKTGKLQPDTLVARQQSVETQVALRRAEIAYAEAHALVEKHCPIKKRGN